MVMKTVNMHKGLTLTWMGVAGIYLTDGITGLLVDPYVSRFGLFHILSGLSLRPDRKRIASWIGSQGAGDVRAVFVTHTHFDHAADASDFALALDAALVGSKSTAILGAASGMRDERINILPPGEGYHVGEFSVRYLESRHGPILGNRYLYPGEITPPLRLPGPAFRYREGGTFSLLIRHGGVKLIHHGSAGYLPGMYSGIEADIVLLGLAGRGDTHAYLENVICPVGARIVIPLHHDNFFRSLVGKKTFPLLPGIRLEEFRKACGVLPAPTRVVEPAVNEPVSLRDLLDRP